MIEFLRAGGVEAPLVVDAAPDAVAPGSGVIRAPAFPASLLLEDEHGVVRRLVWRNIEELGQMRAVPAGRHELVGYRVREKDDEGHEWFVSVSGRKLAELVVGEREPVTVPVDRSVRLQLRLTTELSLQAALQGVGGGGLSLYREGRRLPLEYRVLDPADEVLATGSLKYG